MKLFKCQSCGNLIYFENTSCERCGHRLAYLPERDTVSALETGDDGAWMPLVASGERRFFCANAGHDACNWLTPPDGSSDYCVACSHNGVIPDISDAGALQNWRLMELAKHRLLYQLLRWNLPLATREQDPEHGLQFKFLTDPPDASKPKVMTGHENGIITIALVEADDAEREKRRKQMGEPYRTLLGHFRHEVGHHYWDLLVRDAGKLEACRAVFGDDSQDYGEALKRHYDQGPPADWQEHFISSYATTHPWEDFAESWAHYLHIVDTLEMGASFGLMTRPVVDADGEVATTLDFDPYRSATMAQVVNAWIPFVFAMNSVNRAMGNGDLYPFVLAPDVVTKLGFIHDLVHGRV